MEEQNRAGALHLRSVLPIYPPPSEALELPKLPSPHREPTFDAPYALTTHCIPAAYLRTTPAIPLPPTPPANANKFERQQATSQAFDYLVKVKGEPGSHLNRHGYPQLLWNCVNRYVRQPLPARNGATIGFTLFLAHASGMTKETWEPMLGKLLASEAGLLIDEVWAWESIQHGDAGLINASVASGSFDWTDNARDIVNFLSYFFPRKPTQEILPVHLKQIPEEEAHDRMLKGFQERKLVAVGHSYGATSLNLAACLFPALFTSLILVDPIMFEPSVQDHVDKNSKLLYGALNRRDEWPSRNAAMASFLENPFFRAWDPAALKVYVDSAIFNTHLGTVRLKMPGVMEAVVFVDYYTTQEVYQRMKSLDERLPLRWIMPSRPEAETTGGPTNRVWLRPKNSSHVKIKGAGHLIPQEAPMELAEELRTWLLQTFGSDGRQQNAQRQRSNL